MFTEFVPLTMRNALLESLMLFILFPKQLVHKITHVLSNLMSLKLLKRCVQNVPKKRVVLHTFKELAEMIQEDEGLETPTTAEEALQLYFDLLDHIDALDN